MTVADPPSEPGFRLTVLGCGSSGGVPRLGGGGAGHWGACDPADPRNRRRRCSIMVERFAADGGATRLVVDTGPDFREQMLSAQVAVIDAALYTHDHADHTNGIDDLRQIFLQTRARVPVWADDQTYEILALRFSYVFEQPPGSDYPPILERRAIEEAHIAGGAPLLIDGDGGAIAAWPFRVAHGSTTALGFRFGAPAAGGSPSGAAYLPDASVIPDAAWSALKGLDLFVVDALRYAPHPAHANVDTALAWIERAAPRRAVLTNMHVDLDYRTLDAETPTDVSPAYDGLTLNFAG